VQLGNLEGESMKTVILAGGFGTRFSEETYIRPKPLIEIGGLPIICHLMEIYSQQGFTELIRRSEKLVLELL